MMATASNINGVPGAYGNMATLQGDYCQGGAGFGGGYGGMPNTNNNALHNFGSGNSQSGTCNVDINMHPLHNVHQALMKQQTELLVQHRRAQQQQSGAGNANVSFRERERKRLPMRENVYGHRMGNDSSSQSSSFYSKQQHQRQQQHQSRQKRGRGGW